MTDNIIPRYDTDCKYNFGSRLALSYTNEVADILADVGGSKRVSVGEIYDVDLVFEIGGCIDPGYFDDG